jgi:hypothetical protein
MLEQIGDGTDTDNADKSKGQLRNPKLGFNMAVEAETGAAGVAGSGGQAGTEAEKAKDGISGHTGAIEGMGQLVGQDSQVLGIAGDIAGDSTGTDVGRKSDLDSPEKTILERKEDPASDKEPANGGGS